MAFVIVGFAASAFADPNRPKPPALPEYTIQAYGPGVWYTGIHLADMDGDRRPEVLIGNRNNSAVEIWKYDRSAKVLQLSATVGPFPSHVHDIKAADLDGDGRKDLVVGLRSSGLYVALNTVAGWTLRQVDATYSWQVLLADFDRDGRLDIFDGTDWGYIKIFYGDGAGGFVPGPAPRSASSYGHARGFNVFDLNGDRRPDLIGPASEWASGGDNKYYLRAYLNTESGGALTWSPSVGPAEAVAEAPHWAEAMLNPSAGDVDRNGCIDQVMVTDGGALLLFEGGREADRPGRGPFGRGRRDCGPGRAHDGALVWERRTLDTLSAAATSAGVADLNDDGRPDVHVEGGQGFNGLRAYLGDGDGGFTPAFLSLDHGIGGLNSFVTGDINGDGSVDLVAVRYAGNLYSGFEIFLQK
jgi:hypothetical protein